MTTPRDSETEGESAVELKAGAGDERGRSDENGDHDDVRHTRTAAAPPPSASVARERRRQSVCAFNPFLTSS